MRWWGFTLCFVPALVNAQSPGGATSERARAVIVRDFERGKPGADTHRQPDGWDWADAAGGERYSPGNGYQGSQGGRSVLVRDALPCDAGDNNAWGGHIGLPWRRVGRGDETWARIRVRWPRDWDWTAGGSGTKFFGFSRHGPLPREDSQHHIYFNILEDGDPANPDTDATRRQLYLVNEAGADSGQNPIGNGTSDDPAWDVGAWQTWEMYVFWDTVAADAGGRARIRVWKNGGLVVDKTDDPTLNAPTHFVGDVFFNTYMNTDRGVNCIEYDGSPPRNQTIDYDDIEVRVNERPAARDPAGNPMIGTGSAAPTAASANAEAPVLLPVEPG
jgi:hypothetical protein